IDEREPGAGEESAERPVDLEGGALELLHLVAAGEIQLADVLVVDERVAEFVALVIAFDDRLAEAVAFGQTGALLEAAGDEIADDDLHGNDFHAFDDDG